MNFIAVFIHNNNFSYVKSKQVMEVASWAEELVCCLVRMAPWGCHDGLYFYMLKLINGYLQI